MALDQLTLLALMVREKIQHRPDPRHTLQA